MNRCRLKFARFNSLGKSSGIILLITISIAFLARAVPAQTLGSLEQKSLMQKEIPPRFEDFPVSKNFKGKPARVNLSSHPEARRFRTNLREGAKEEPNFAEHYTVISWGCGTDCQAITVVDAITGNVYFAPFSTSLGADFRINSSLFIADPPDDIKDRYGEEAVPEWLRSKYYKWEKEHFMLIYPTEVKKK